MSRIPIINLDEPGTSHASSLDNQSEDDHSGDEQSGDEQSEDEQSGDDQTRDDKTRDDKTRDDKTRNDQTSTASVPVYVVLSDDLKVSSIFIDPREKPKLLTDLKFLQRLKDEASLREESEEYSPEVSSQSFMETTSDENHATNSGISLF